MYTFFIFLNFISLCAKKIIMHMIHSQFIEA
jgi:hypothetical protein